MSKLEQNPQPDQLFNPDHSSAQRFAAGEVNVTRQAPKTIDSTSLESDLDRLDGQGQTNLVTAQARVGGEFHDGEAVPILPRPPKRAHRPIPRPRRWERPSSSLNPREKRNADQPPPHERFDPYA